MLLLAPASLHAQSSLAVGARGGYHGLHEDASIGAELLIRLSGRLALRPSFDALLVEIGSETHWNLDLQATIAGPVYLGAGYTRRRLSLLGSSAGRNGANLFGGVMFGKHRLQLWAEGRVLFEDGNEGSVLGGVRYRF